MAKQRLTDKTLASSVSLNDIVHIVKTGDTSQNPAGSSYKATVSQIVSTYSGTSVTGLTFNNTSYDLTLGLDDGSSFSDNLGILASDIKVTGGTYNSSTGEITFVNNSGGTFVVSGVTIEGLPATLTADNTTGGNNITITSGDVINASAGGGTINLTDSGQPSEISITTDSGSFGESWHYLSPTTQEIGFANNYYVLSSGGVVFNRLNNPSNKGGFSVGPNQYSMSSLAPSTAVTTTLGGGIVVMETGSSGATSQGGFYGVFLNSGGGPALSFFNNNVIRSVALGGTGLNVKTNDTAYANKISLQPSGSTFDGLLSPSALTADRTYTLQDGSGTIAFLSDITTFTGNTSGTCITDLYLTNLYGCSPINIQNDTIINGGLTGTSGLFSSATDNVLNVVGSGNSTSNPLFKVEGSSGELFSITDTLEGSLFSVNDISGLPILDVNSDSTIEMGSITAPSLFTTVLTTATGGTENIYSLPTSAYTGGFFDYTLVGNGGARAGVITSIWSGTTTQYQDVSTNDIGSSTSGVTFDVSVSGNDAILSVSAITGTYTIKTIVRSI